MVSLFKMQNQSKAMYQITAFRHSQLDLFQGMTFPSFHHLLDRIETEEAIFAYTASYSDQPAALIVGEISAQDKTAEILSIFVEPSHRCRGVGTELVRYLDDQLRARGCPSISLKYISGKPTNDAFERMLQKCLWSEPEVQEIVCKGHVNNGIQMPWVTRNNYFDDSYHMFPWRKITDEEISSIQRQRDIIPGDLYPLQYNHNMEEINSFGLRYQGEVVGWLISHRISPDTIRYTCSFIRQDLQKIGRNLGLMAEAIKRQHQAQVPYIIWTTPIHHQGMVEFTKKRISPYLIYLREIKKSHKFL